MPFVSNMNDDEENKQNQPQGSQGTVSPSGAGGGAVRLAPSAAVPSGGAATSTSTGPASAGGQFGSMGQYLSANMGQAEPLAGKLTAGIGNEYQGLQDQNKAVLSSIGSQVSAQPDYSKSNDIIAQESANPTSFTGDSNNVASFQNLLKASYSGPTSAEGTSDYANQQAAINKSISQGQDAVQTQAGRENLLSQNEAKPTTGVTALNSAILSKSPTALASVQDAYKPFQNLLTGLQSGAADQNKAIADKQAQATAAKQTATDALKSQITGLNTSVGNELTTAQQKLAAQNAQVKSELAAGTPSDSTLQALGVTRDQWNSLSAAQKAAATPQDVLSNQGQFGATTGTTNIDLNNFLSQNDPNTILNAGNVATKADYDKAAAFQSLLGGLDLGTPTMAINPAAAVQAGTAPTNANAFDYQTALNTAQQAKSDELASAQAYVDALQSGADETHAQLAAQKAQKVSTGVGAATLLAPTVAGTAAAGAGYGLGAYNSAKDVISNPTLKNTAQLLNSTLGPASVVNAAKGAGAAITSAVNTVTSIFCFHPDTLVTMDNGSQLPICRIGVGDITKGGKVLATTRAVAREFYWYNGVLVTGKHAVKEDGKWIRVENTRLGHRIPLLTEVVCNLVTEDHRIYANGIEFADQYETDLYESLDMDESLQELNKYV